MFYVASVVAIVATILMITRLNAVHALAVPDRFAACGRDRFYALALRLSPHWR